jgi:ABC-type oligopeptide transport system substrate-binding subunit
MKLRIGAHVSASGGLESAVERAKRIGAECVQVFVGSPRVWAAPPPDLEVAQRFHDKAIEAELVLRSRDFDMVPATWGQSNSPGNEQMEFWHSRSADSAGSRNFIGLRDPAIDKLVEGLIRSDSRQNLIVHARALDRVLLWGHYVVPNYYVDTWRIAYWNHFQRPATTPLYDYGLFTWWAKPGMETASQSEQNPPEPDAQ